MRVMTAREASAARRAKWQGYGEYFARQWREHRDQYAALGYADPQKYRRDTVRQCWPQVSDHLKGYIRAGFNRELGAR